MTEYAQVPAVQMVGYAVWMHFQQGNYSNPIKKAETVTSFVFHLTI